MKQKEQVLEILTQAINIAVGSGAFKNTKDVAVINQALEFVEKDYKSEPPSKSEEVIEGSAKPDKK